MISYCIKKCQSFKAYFEVQVIDMVDGGHLNIDNDDETDAATTDDNEFKKEIIFLTLLTLCLLMKCLYMNDFEKFLLLNKFAKSFMFQMKLSYLMMMVTSLVTIIKEICKIF